MARNNSKKRKKPTNQPFQQKDGTAQKVYLKRLYEMANLTGCAEAFHLLTKKEKTTIYFYRLHYRHPQPAEGTEITPDALKELSKIIRFYQQSLFNRFPKHTDKEVSINDLMAINALKDFIYTCHDSQRVAELQQAFAPLLQALEEFGNPIQRMYGYYNYITLMENRCDETMFGFTTSLECRNETVLGLYHELYIHEYEPRISHVTFGGKSRTVFQLGWPLVNTGVSWKYLPVEWLGDLYKGDKKHLPICIQTHALNRFYDRTKALNPMVRVQLEFNIPVRDNFTIYQNQLLFSFHFCHIKVGYFVANLVGNRVIIRTFLLVTHHYTPEGNKLEELSGLAKEDINYWQIDNISTFVDNKLEDHPKIKALFEAAGLSSLFELRETLKHTDLSNSFNIEGLVKFIEQGNQEISNHPLEDDWAAVGFGEEEEESTETLSTDKDN
ncbi:hypothetical protein DMA11_20505 [Marinilabiliaceae bacterium JC017]|nr:hypothetical protein DMA11_20505 [Marinilabiliaceae bacterium JC017]